MVVGLIRCVANQYLALIRKKEPPNTSAALFISRQIRIGVFHFEAELDGRLNTLCDCIAYGCHVAIC